MENSGRSQGRTFVEELLQRLEERSLKRPPAHNPTIRDQLRECENAIDAAGDDREKRRDALIRRGRLLTQFGLPSAVQDMLQALCLRRSAEQKVGPQENQTDLAALGKQFDELLEQEGLPYGELGLTAEAIRVHVRDHLLSLPKASAAAETWLRRSIKAFEKAIAASHRASPVHRAWTEAHCGAAYVKLFWLLRLAGPSKLKGEFEAAEGHFGEALRLYAGSPTQAAWTVRFLALLYAVRGENGDVRKCELLLDSVQTGDKLDQSSLSRSKALLLLHSAWRTVADGDTPEQRTSAASRAFNEGLQATRNDHEDALAAYAVALSSFFLCTEDTTATKEEVQLRRRDALIAAENAWTRAQNTFSQACAAIASTGLVIGELMNDPEHTERAKEFADLVRRANVLDLETQLLFERDPMLRRHDEAMFSSVRQALTDARSLA